MDERRSEGVNDGARTVIVRERGWTRVAQHGGPRRSCCLLRWRLRSCGSSGARSRRTSSRASSRAAGSPRPTPRPRRLPHAAGQQSRHRRSQAARPRRSPGPSPDAPQMGRQLRSLSDRRARRPAARPAGERARQLGPGRQNAARADHQEAAVQAAQRRPSTSPTATIALATPFGPIGVALAGQRAASAAASRAVPRSPAPGWCRARCEALNLRTNLAVAVMARRPHVEGPVALDRFNCPASHIDDRRPAIRRQGQLQRSLHQLRRQRPDGDRDHDRRRQRPRRLHRRHQLQGLARPASMVG